MSSRIGPTMCNIKWFDRFFLYIYFFNFQLLLIKSYSSNDRSAHQGHTCSPVSTKPPQKTPCPSFKRFEYFWDTLIECPTTIVFLFQTPDGAGGQTRKGHSKDEDIIGKRTYLYKAGQVSGENIERKKQKKKCTELEQKFV